FQVLGGACHLANAVESGLQALGALALADVAHGTDCAGGLALGIADHVAAVEDVGVGAVPAPEAVLRRPELFSAVEPVVEVGEHALAIFRVDALIPPPLLGWSVGVGISEQGPNPLAPPGPVLPEVPVPDRVVGGEGNQAEALLALPGGSFRALALGDVARDT